jgi:hypothetical protein
MSRRCTCCGDIGQKSHTFKEENEGAGSSVTFEKRSFITRVQVRGSVLRALLSACALLVLRGHSVGRLYRSVSCTAQLDALPGWLHVEVSYRFCRFDWKSCSVGW